MTFNPLDINTFRFISCDFEEKSSSAIFKYAFDDSHFFEERYQFHNLKLPLNNERLVALRESLKFLHLMSGISYYKAAIPSSIRIEYCDIPEEAAAFFNNIYYHGLGEFAFRNGIDLSNRINFPFTKKACRMPSNIDLNRKTAVPVGGGKDSVVTIEALKSQHEPMILFSLGNFKVIEDVEKLTKIPSINVSRRLSNNLFELNAQGAFNGHIPISAIIAFVLPVAAILYNFDSAALSNERSANEGNIFSHGREVNHQYSKSYEFEQKVSKFIKDYILEDFNYFSFLRPFSDLSIARLFSKCSEYHATFKSCNNAFKISERNNNSWCLNCPKCRFTFLALAPFLKKRDLLRIFNNKNLLDDLSQLRGFQELIGVEGHKPFECVGEIKESMAALILLTNNIEWRNDNIVRYFAKEILPTIKDPGNLIEESMKFSKKHMLSKHYEEIIYAYSRSKGEESSGLGTGKRRLVNSKGNKKSITRLAAYYTK